MQDYASLHWAHPLVREWFLSRFGSPTEPQEQGWPHILAGRNTLISAPTGSGKTLAAFLACIERLVRKSLSGELKDQTEVLYVSPLRALSNDIQKNLQIPLSEILQLGMKDGPWIQEIRATVRTGDTLTRDRQAMLRRPPHILVTTPESLYILLTATKSREMLRTVETVIVDEIHAVADDKRGAHLSLSLQRLDALTIRKPVRIGLSATQKPIEEVAQFLCGAEASEVSIVDIGHKRELDLGIEVPDMELGSVASHEMWDEIHEKIAQLAQQHRSTLVFVNTRKLAERTAHRLSRILGENSVAAHHGSLARKLRLAAERKLKNGELKALVATASLELGIDIGLIDLVCQIGSPRAIGIGLQRVGRSGHWRGALPKGRFFPTTRDELVECAALVHAIRSGDLDRLMIPSQPLDILAQQIVAACAAEDWNEDRLFDLARKAYPYRDLSRSQFDSILEMLSDGIASARGRFGSYLHRDRVNGTIRARRGARLTAITSGGAIPETGAYTVIAEPEGNVVGTLDEDFAVESNGGDIVLLGSTSWMIRRVQSSTARVFVEDAHGAPPTIPFWRGEAPARTQELSKYVSLLRECVAGAISPPLLSEGAGEGCAPIQPPPSLPLHKGEESVLNPGASLPLRKGEESTPNPHTDFELQKGEPASEVGEVLSWLITECGLDRSGAEQIIVYIREGVAVLGAPPTQKRIIAERFFDESGGMQLVIHSPFGGRINRAWGLALRKRFCRSFNLELQASATDDGLNISLTEQHSFPLADVFRFLHPNTVEEVLTQAAFASPLFATRWRWDAMRALAVSRFQRGKKIPLQILRMRSEDLLASVFPDAAACQDNVVGDIQLPDHPLVNETMKDVLNEAMDVEGLKKILNGIHSGDIECMAVDTPVPSQFCHEILNAQPYAYLDDAPLEERRARAVAMRRTLPDSTIAEVGMLDPDAISEVVQQCHPDIRSQEDLHDLLLTVISLPADESWQEFFQVLLNTRRAGVARIENTIFWFAAEKSAAFFAGYPRAEILQSPASILQNSVSEEDGVWMIIRGWMPILGPVSIEALSAYLKLSTAQVEQAIARLEASGSILRGNFNRNASTEWCDRRILARIHRMTLGALRKQIEPVTAAQFIRWLFRWQHVAPGTQVYGERGTLEAIRQLQGFEIPAREWERRILATRVSDYNPAFLDRLCWTGTVGWGRFSSPMALSTSRKNVPGSAAPITFFVREDSDWLRNRRTPALAFTEQASIVHQCLKEHGALFVSDLARFAEMKKREVEESLWELVTAGIVTADGFDSLRSLLNHRKKVLSSNRSTAGRWSILHTSSDGDTEKTLEAFCRMLLDRYGVVFRDVVQRETLLPRWRDLLVTFRRLEGKGEIRGGRFVSGFVGEQFALPLAVDSLRTIRKIEPSGEMVTLSAADPLNLAGYIVPGARLPATAREPVTFRDGVVVAPTPIPELES